MKNEQELTKHYLFQIVKIRQIKLDEFLEVLGLTAPKFYGRSSEELHKWYRENIYVPNVHESVDGSKVNKQDGLHTLQEAIKTFAFGSCVTLIAANWYIENDRISTAIEFLLLSESALIQALTFHYGVQQPLLKKTDSAKKSAIARHASTYALKTQIINYWKLNVSRDKSNEFAAEILQKTFPQVSHRTLVKYVSEAKNTLC